MIVSQKGWELIKLRDIDGWEYIAEVDPAGIVQELYLPLTDMTAPVVCLFEYKGMDIKDLNAQLDKRKRGR